MKSGRLVIVVAAVVLSTAAALQPQCSVAHGTTTFCICTGRNANDLSLQSFTVQPPNPNQDSNVGFSYGATIDMQWIPNGASMIQTVLYVDGIARQRKLIPIEAPPPFISGLNPPVGPGTFSFNYGSGNWDQIGGNQIFFQQTFYDNVNNIMLCIRSPIMTPS